MSALRRSSLVWLLAGAVGAAVHAQQVGLPNLPDSLKLAVIGDNGTGDRPQYELGQIMARAREQFAFELVLMLGDNFYGSQTAAADRQKKFELPYQPLLDAGVRFHAVLGNHDDPAQRFYEPFGMGGQRYYTFARGHVRFVAIDSTGLDRPQLVWLEGVLRDAREDWLICYLHYPLYSNAGRHGSDVELRVLLEPLFVAHGVDIVFAGHDHIYERIRPQKGITYFVAGSGGKLRRGDLRRSPSTAAGFDQDQAFVLLEVIRDELYFQTLSRMGVTVDSGVIYRETAFPAASSGRLGEGR